MRNRQKPLGFGEELAQHAGRVFTRAQLLQEVWGYDFFGGTRTVHRMTCAIEDAGWEIRDMLVWGYASGFPKSLDVSKAIDKAAGAEREVVGTRTSAFGDTDESETGDGRNLWAKPSTTSRCCTGRQSRPLDAETPRPITLG